MRVLCLIASALFGIGAMLLTVSGKHNDGLLIVSVLWYIAAQLHDIRENR